MIWANALLPEAFFSALYLARYRHRSRLVSAVAWLTLGACVGVIGFVLLSSFHMA
jgi:hypothetical protein